MHHKKPTTLSLLATTLAALILTLAVLEIFFRFLPVNELLLSQPVNAASPMLRFVPNQTLLRSNGPFFSMQNTVHSNNYGFINNQDYDKEAVPPLLSVIGDSYVEAVMVPYSETGFGRLATTLQGRMRVYSFGRSGAPLSQYLATAKWVHEEFSPQCMVFVIVGNDFDESLFKYKQAPGFSYFKEENGELKLKLIDYTPGLGVQVITRSKLLMYLVTNLHIIERLQGLFKPRPKTEYVGQTIAQASEERLRDSEKAVNAFFKALPQAAQLPPDRILFVVDGIRPDLYDPKMLAQDSSTYFWKMRHQFMRLAKEQGYRTVDMQQVFIEDWKQHHRRFEFEGDMHWNGYAHGLFAREVLRSGLVEAVLSSSGRIPEEAP
ncbi:SGNH/GDSL hydrolase family protein [Paucidesulfovibrio longus]|uniref:SGNH/GDSL hydrolase family protein n=1 Tax=Paucidesulfovibrio longus TaxID=889 RepID=UPI0003B2FF47|nr:SGNH/GDSL hydrolase family protein [Paucidesulfovibrio longus]